jgi:two-component system, cell cycle sensor histidine kinase and response regulator CckA
MGPARAATILLVDDESFVRGVAFMALQRRGHTVYVAHGGEDGLRHFREHRHEIDIVVSDINMPDMTGPQMVEIMRRERPDLAVLFISGHNNVLPDWAKRTCGVLAKPFMAPPFVAKVEECLEL